MQVSTKDVDALVIPKIIQEQVQVGGDIGKIVDANADKIEVDLEKTILMIERQEDVVAHLITTKNLVVCNQSLCNWHATNCFQLF
jgi:hypothetical protein